MHFMAATILMPSMIEGFSIDSNSNLVTSRARQSNVSARVVYYNTTNAIRAIHEPARNNHLFHHSGLECHFVIVFAFVHTDLRKE
jgi:hypothetical protein